jgi:hypothetical protein
MEPVTGNVLAWCSWRLRMPEEWRPLRLEGTDRAGNVMIGTATEAILKVSWAKVPPARVKRLWSRRVKKRSATRREAPPPRGFADCAILRPRKGTRTTWVGCAQPAGLLLELVYSQAPGDGRANDVERLVLPSLAAEGPEDAAGSLWAIFGASFLAPRGFRLMGQSLHLGEVSLRLARGKDVLFLGQVYPADLALSRRPMGFWLWNWPWETNALRRFRARGEDRPWRVATEEGEMAGLLRRGRKRLRWPLGFLAPRRVVCGAVVDPRLGRILRGAVQSPAEPEESVLQAAVLGMNRAEGEAPPC